jgi:hypothetical protein
VAHHKGRERGVRYHIWVLYHDTKYETIAIPCGAHPLLPFPLFFPNLTSSSRSQLAASVSCSGHLRLLLYWSCRLRLPASAVAASDASESWQDLVTAHAPSPAVGHSRRPGKLLCQSIFTSALLLRRPDKLLNQYSSPSYLVRCPAYSSICDCIGCD